MTSLSSPRRPVIVPPRPTVKALLLVGAFALLGIGVGIAIMVPILWRTRELGDLAWLLVLMVGFSAAAMYYALRIRLKWGWQEIGFRPPRVSLWHLLWEVPLAFIFFPILTMLFVSPFGGAPAGESQGMAEIEASASAPALILLLLCAVIIAPVLEEIFFRRLLIDVLGRWMPVGGAIICAAVLFGFVHAVPPVMVYTFLLGAACGLLYWRHGTLWAPIALHMFNNAMAMAATLSVLFLS